MPRPKKEVNTTALKALVSVHCSWDEIEDKLGVSRRTLMARFPQVIAEGRADGRISLRRKRFEIAMGGNVPMLIWLSKQILGESDKVAHQADNTQFALIEKVQGGVVVGETVLRKSQE